MRRKNSNIGGRIKRTEVYIGESIENMLAKRLEGESIDINQSQLIYTDRKDGVLPQTNIRTDQFDVAMMSHDAIERARMSAKENISKNQKSAKDGDSSDTESTQGTKAEA